MVSDCETTSTYNELKYLLLKRSSTKPGHSYEQQLTFPLTFYFLKICHMTYKSRTENKIKTKKTKRCAINGRLFPLKWCFSRWPLTAATPSFILFLVWFGVSSVDDWVARLIHKFQATAFSSISIVIYKVRAHHFLRAASERLQPFLDTAPVCSIFKPTHLSPPWPAEVAKESPWLPSVCSSRGFKPFLLL